MQRIRTQKVQNPQQSELIQKNLPVSDSQPQKNNTMPLNELWLQLSRYRDLKQLSLNPISEPKDQLWRDSPCTVRCPNRNISFDRIQRFRLGSIYYRDNINEQKKVFTESQKPELMLKNFRRQVEEASHFKQKYNRKFSQATTDKAKTNISLGKTMPLMNNKFYEVPNQIQLKYDRNGARSTFKGEYDVKQIINKFRETKSNFTSSRRMDLALPLNFNPGPGKYFAESENLNEGNRTHRSKKIKSKFESRQNSEREFQSDSIKLN